MFIDPGEINVEQDLRGGRSGEGKATLGRLLKQPFGIYCNHSNARVTGDSDTGEEVENEGETDDEGEETTIRRLLLYPHHLCNFAQVSV